MGGSATARDVGKLPGQLWSTVGVEVEEVFRRAWP
jgi:hypothetical protein